jgi:formate-dependent nitrite reductase cytochrome c552 subunit
MKNGNLAKAVAYNALALPLFVLWLGYTFTASYNVVRDIKKYSIKEQIKV